MKATGVAGVVLALALLGAASGCGDMTPLTAADFASPGAPGHASEDHGHRAANGGVVASVGDTHHVEALYEPRTKRVRVFVLGEDEAELYPIPAETLGAEATTAGGDVLPLTLRARLRPGDPPGKAAEFAAALPSRADHPAGLTVTLPIGDRLYRFRLDLSGAGEAGASGMADVAGSHADESADAAPTPEERALFLTPGGRYTDADIRANGSQIPRRKFAGVPTNHNATPPPGARVCPISETLANPRFAWVIGGETYTFCCPPCVGEFLQRAKEEPGAIRPPGAYVKR